MASFAGADRASSKHAFVYLLKRGYLGALRLQVLAQAAGPGTNALLDRLPWERSWSCLDVGCGLGFVARELASRCARVTGVDCASEFIQAAQQLGGADFRQLDVAELPRLEDRFQVICARYLLSHLSEPGRTIKQMAQCLQPGGYLVLEDVDFPGHIWEPACPALDRYVQLYQECARLRGGDARLGRKLQGLVQQAGLTIDYLGVNLPLHHNGPERRVAELTLSHIGAALRQFDLISRPELAALLREIRQWRRQGGLISLAPTVQLIARAS